MTTEQPSTLDADHYHTFKFRLDPTDAQRIRFEDEARAAKFAYNFYRRHWRTCHNNWRSRRDQLIEQGLDRAEANKKTTAEAKTDPTLKALSWTSFDTQVITPLRQKHHRVAEIFEALNKPDLDPSQRSNLTTELERIWPRGKDKQPWMHRVSRRSLTTGLKNLSAAVQNYNRSFQPGYTGPKVGKPRFKNKNARASITMDGQVIGAYGAYNFRRSDKIDNHHRIRLGEFRSVRTYNSTKPLSRALQRGGEAKSFTLTEKAGRWYVSIRVIFTAPQIRPTTRRQRTNKSIGLDFGVHTWLALSDGQLISLPPRLKAYEKKAAALQRKLARAKKGSKRRKKLVRQLSKTKHEIALQRNSFIHNVTTTLAQEFEIIAIEDLNVKGMTASARGTVENPGKNVRAHSSTTRGILAGAPGELRRQLEYKTRRYGSRLVVVGRFYPSSQLCSHCGHRKRDLKRNHRTYRCLNCDQTFDRDINAAVNIREEGLRLLREEGQSS
ncbi:RNA-guided endonuclease InsQ/TnpB family protein [Corynebacterium urogenitale]